MLAKLCDFGVNILRWQITKKYLQYLSPRFLIQDYGF